MNYISEKDYFEAHGASIISNVDFDVVARLYQPIIGFKAMSVYFTLVNYINNSEGEIYTHLNIFKIMQIEPGEFLTARRALEATGLVKTFYKVEGDIKKYKYVIYAPLNPKKFFNDVLFKGMLVKYIGEKEAINLAMHYQVKCDLTNYKDISSNFVDVFQPDFNDSSFDALMPKGLKSTDAMKVGSNFKLDEFFNKLKESTMILEKGFSKKEIDNIHKLAILYNLDEESMVGLVAEHYISTNVLGKRLDFDKLKTHASASSKFDSIVRKNKEGLSSVLVDGRVELNSEIDNIMKLTPIEYLKYRQDGGRLASADKNLINELVFDIGLSDSVINALIDYVLNHHNNRLEKNYVEKIAVSLKRAKINNGLDAYNALNNRQNKNIVETKLNIKKKRDVEMENDENDEINDDEVNQMLNELMKGKK